MSLVTFTLMVNDTDENQEKGDDKYVKIIKKKNSIALPDSNTLRKKILNVKSICRS